MPELWAAKDAVNRKFKELWAAQNGTNRKLKEVWARDSGGVNRKIFSGRKYYFYVLLSYTYDAYNHKYIKKYDYDGNLVATSAIVGGLSVRASAFNLLYNPHTDDIFAPMYWTLSNDGNESRHFRILKFNMATGGYDITADWGSGLADGNTNVYKWSFGLDPETDNPIIGITNTGDMKYGFIYRVYFPNLPSYHTNAPYGSSNIVFFDGHVYASTYPSIDTNGNASDKFFSKGVLETAGEYEVVVKYHTNLEISKFGTWCCGMSNLTEYGTCDPFAKNGEKVLSEAAGTWLKKLYDSNGNLVVVTTSGLYYFTVNKSSGEPTFARSVSVALSDSNACINPDNTILIKKDSTSFYRISSTGEVSIIGVSTGDDYIEQYCCDMGYPASFSEYY